MKFLTQKEMTPEELSLYSDIQEIIWEKFTDFMGNKEVASVITLRTIEILVARRKGFRMASLCHLFFIKPIIINAAGNIICLADETTYNPEMIR